MPLRERNPSTEAVFPLQGPHYLEMSPAQWRLKLERELAVSAHVQNFFLFLSNLSHQAWLHAAVVQLPIFRFLLVRSVLRAARSHGL